MTVLHEGRLHLRIDPRADGMPWLADTASLARALAEVSERLAGYSSKRGQACTRAPVLRRSRSSYVKTLLARAPHPCAVGVPASASRRADGGRCRTRAQASFMATIVPSGRMTAIRPAP